MKMPLILWSGGLDSTYLLFDRLKQGYSVDVLTVDLKNNKEIQEHERNAIKELKSIIANSSLTGRIRNHYTYKVSKVKSPITHAQPLIWVFSMMAHVNPKLHNCIEIGYVREDDFWHEHTKIMDYTDLIMDVHLEEKILIQFPLEWYRKSDMISILKKHPDGKKLLKKIRYCLEWYRKSDMISILKKHPDGKKLLKKIRYCEEIKKKPCGKCISCVKHKTALLIADNKL